jgi:hypothetical protein
MIMAIWAFNELNVNWKAKASKEGGMCEKVIS